MDCDWESRYNAVPVRAFEFLPPEVNNFSFDVEFPTWKFLLRNFYIFSQTRP